MKLGFILGWFNSQIILALDYVIVLQPTSFAPDICLLTKLPTILKLHKLNPRFKPPT